MKNNKFDIFPNMTLNRTFKDPNSPFYSIGN